MKQNTIHECRTGNELSQLAWTIATHITIRTGAMHTSHDDTWETTDEEANIIHDIAWAALLTMNHFRFTQNWDADAQAATQQAEYQAIIAFENKFDDEDTHVNTYDTIYIPLMNAFQEWPVEA